MVTNNIYLFFLQLHFGFKITIEKYAVEFSKKRMVVKVYKLEVG